METTAFMDRRFMAILLVTVAILGGIFWFSKQGNGSSVDTDSGSAQPSQHVKGANNKKVAIVEYGDFQCPACGGFFPILQSIKQKYGDDISFQFRNFPLDSIHQNARAAHRAAEAAGLQGKYWEMHDILYGRQSDWTPAANVADVFETYAKELNLDIAKFNLDRQSAQVNKVINADIKEGQNLQVESTPTFVINGKKIDSQTQKELATVEGFSKYIDSEIAKAAQ